MYGTIPDMFDYWAHPVVNLLLQESSMVDSCDCLSSDCKQSQRMKKLWRNLLNMTMLREGLKRLWWGGRSLVKAVAPCQRKNIEKNINIVNKNDRSLVSRQSSVDSSVPTALGLSPVRHLCFYNLSVKFLIYLSCEKN